MPLDMRAALQGSCDDAPAKPLLESYELGHTIGQGSYGKAVLASRRQDQQQLVIKRVRISDLDEKERQEAVNEVKLLSTFDHLNVIKYQECIVEDGYLNIVMEYAEHGELSSMIQAQAAAKKAFTEDEIMFWFVQIVLGLWHVHSCNVLHRDLKSQNIFVASGNILKLGDFGIAKVLTSETELARTVIGTPYYLSPEICEDKPYNRKSDVWALGCVLYELCTLKRAFDGGNLPALVMKILRGRYPPVSSRYSSHLRSLVDQMLQLNPGNRPGVDALLRMDFVRLHLTRYAAHVLTLHQGRQVSLGYEGLNAPAAAAAAAARSSKTARSPAAAKSARKGLAGPAGGGARCAAPDGKKLAEAVDNVHEERPQQDQRQDGTPAAAAAAAAASVPGVLAGSEPAHIATELASDAAGLQNHVAAGQQQQQEQQEQQQQQQQRPPAHRPAIAAHGADEKKRLIGDTWFARQHAAMAECKAAFQQLSPSPQHAGRARGAADTPPPPHAVPDPAAAASQHTHDVEDGCSSSDDGCYSSDPDHDLPHAGASAADVPAARPAASHFVAVEPPGGAPEEPGPSSAAAVPAGDARACKAALEKPPPAKPPAAKAAPKRAVPRGAHGAKHRPDERQKAAEAQRLEAQREEQRRAKRAVQLEQQIKQKEEGRRQEKQAAAQQVAVHREQVRAAQPKVTKRQLAKLGAQFAQRLQQQHTDPSGQVILVDFSSSSASSTCASHSNSHEATPAPSSNASPHRVRDATAAAAVPAVAPSAVGGQRLAGRQRSRRTTLEAGGQSAGGLPPPQQQQQVAVAAQAERPWKLKRTKRQPDEAVGFPAVEIFAPYGSMSTPLVQPPNEGACTADASNAAPSDNCQAGADDSASGNLLQVLEQITGVLSGESTLMDAEADGSGNNNAGQGGAAAASAVVPATAAADCSPATAALKAQQLRFNLEQQLGAERLAATSRYLQRVQHSASVDDGDCSSCDGDLITILGSKVHLARQVYKLMMLEDPAAKATQAEPP